MYDQHGPGKCICTFLVCSTVNPRIKAHGLKNGKPPFCLTKGKICGPFIGPGHLCEGGCENETDDKKHHIFPLNIYSKVLH